MLRAGAERPYRICFPADVPDELRGDVDLFEAHNLSRIANAVLGGALKHGDYLRGMTGATEFRKWVARVGLLLESNCRMHFLKQRVLRTAPHLCRGPNLLLAPLAAHASVDQDMVFEPIPLSLLEQGCNLRTGHFELTEVRCVCGCVVSVRSTHWTGVFLACRLRKEYLLSQR